MVLFQLVVPTNFFFTKLLFAFYDKTTAPLSNTTAAIKNQAWSVCFDFNKEL